MRELKKQLEKIKTLLEKCIIEGVDITENAHAEDDFIYYHVEFNAKIAQDAEE